MTLSEIQRTLSRLQTSPTKSLGQNFLHDQNLARWIVAQLKIEPGDHIVEVGPGLGALTEYLAETGNTLTLIEKDDRLIDYLRERFERGTTRVFHADALDFDLRELWGRGPVKLVGNLPYYVSTPLIAKFTSALSPASLLVLTLQLELARRLDAAPATKDYGAMSVCVNRRWKASYLRKLPASVFFPAPHVDSAVVTLEKRPGSTVAPLDESAFDSLVRRGFSERRKQLRNLLDELRPRWPELTAMLGVPETVRAEELTLSQWEELTRRVSPASAQSGEEMFDVVDENDRVLRAEPRKIVHVNNLRHRAVHVLAFNAAGEVFLQKRSIWKDRNPGRWDSSSAGHVDSGETYLEAARREFREELGVDCPPLERIGRLTPSEMNGWEFIEIYVTRHEGPFQPAAMEVETGAFFSTEMIARWTAANPDDFSPVFLACWQLVRA
ncbi:MAG: 16S rRNA (adenine(1518)-N(6)/adenine(1519)-N(6))-dimethyltransferase RsmA [Terrimicrobiaceae bacterium]|nr:16S rRNA (adenine(1518)-N(6)/adenine(1519)-N(6))-dimethyltransferase RsmA [Terrimicrobiaceae bacterium]